jgi:hypothetical protein
MKRSIAAILGTALATVLLGAAPATAEQVTVSDPQGNSSSTALDLLGVTARNLDRAVVVTMTFVHTTERSDIIVSVDPRRGTGVRMVSKFRPAGLGRTRNFVLRKAFTDRGISNKKIACRGLELSEGMADAGPTITLRMPSKCLNDANFGAVRFAVLIEGESSGNADSAPQEANGNSTSTRWVSRG